MLEVVVGILGDRLGRVLVNERPHGRSRAGAWEFPGGKCEPGEIARDALVRELREELGIEVRTAERYIVLSHDYPGSTGRVRLDCWRVTHWSGEPRGVDGQALRWCAPDDLPSLGLLEADLPLVTALRLPSLFVYEPSGERLAKRLAARAQKPAPGRVAWLTGTAAPDRASLPWVPTDLLGLVDDRGGAPYRRVLTPRVPDLGFGAVVEDAAGASAAHADGAAYLLVSTPAAPADLGAAVGALGLPYYMNVAADAKRAPPARELIAPVPLPTGQLWWPVSA